MNLDIVAIDTLMQDIDRRYEPLNKKIELRRQHYHNEQEADPLLKEPYESNATHYQSDILRKTHTQLKSRLTENHFTVKVHPYPNTESQRKLANKHEAVLNEGISQVERRERFSIQGGLSDGLGCWCYGVLHWAMAKHHMPDMPDKEYLDDVGGEADRYEKVKDDDEDREKGAYRQKDDDYLTQRAEAVAKSGYPWHIEIIPPEMFRFLPDRGAANGMGLAYVAREIGLLQYAGALKQNKMILSLNDQDKKLRVYQEHDAPDEGSPSGSVWGERIEVRQFWTRDEYYEVAKVAGGVGGTWELVQSFKHCYGMPPFALAVGDVVEDARDPVRKYEPALEGLYRIKPAYDRAMTLMMVLSEDIALPMVFLESVKDGRPMLRADGSVLTFTKNAIAAQKIPDGYTIRTLEKHLEPAFVQSLLMLKEELADAAPDTGQAEVTASSQPWQTRLAQAQASIVPHAYLENTRVAIEIMVQNMAMVHGHPDGFGEGIYVRAMKGYEGVKEGDSIGIEPEDVQNFMVTVSIKPTSAAERITLEEHGRTLLNDPLVPMTKARFLEDYMDVQDPDEWIVEHDAEESWDMYVKPFKQQQLVVAMYGTDIMLGLNGEFVGMDPETMQATGVPPAEVVSRNGGQPVNSQPPPNQGVPGQQVRMSGLPAAEVPGTIPLNGVVG